MAYDRAYYWRKAFALYPGGLRPISAPVFEAHYRERAARRGWLRAGLDMAVGAGFRLWIPWRARAVQRKFGSSDLWRRRATAIARATFADPNDIALFRIEDEDTARTFIRRFEDAAFNKRINPLGWTPDCVLTDKARFAERCVAAGLPIPETIATVKGADLTMLAEPGGRSLVAKPVAGEGGDGLTMLGPIAGEQALRGAMRSLGTDEAVVIQPLIETHAELRDLSLAALPTVRIVTMLDEHSRPEIVSATFRCPSDPQARVDNMKAGGLIVAVELESGRLGAACKGYGGGDYRQHPVTGADIEGRILPDWVTACGLVRRAHGEAFADYALIGWDVALTPDGPVLIEGNGKPGVLMPQRAARKGLAQGRYGELLAYHLATKS
jgi:hypothetical protein